MCIIKMLCCTLYEQHMLMVYVYFNDPATTEIYTLSLHDALPMSAASQNWLRSPCPRGSHEITTYPRPTNRWTRDRKSTRLNSSHSSISYAVFCLKKKKQFRHQHHAPLTLQYDQHEATIAKDNYHS